jgi:outer membrane protein assembly factor BamD
MQNLKKQILLSMVLSSLFLSGCANKTPKDPYKNLEARLIYNSGLKNLKKYRYEEAVKDFDGLESHYPFGEYTDKSQLASIYAHYKQSEHAEALAKAERFIRMHPRHEHVVYAYYMKGVIHFAESVGFVARYFPMERSERDSKAAEEAFDAFNVLIERFPNSCYVPEAKKRLVYLYTVLSENELHAARYYLKRKAYIAAANRSSTILERYPRSYVREEALCIQIKAYRKLGLFCLANDSLAVLRANYPNSTYIRTL